MRNSSAAAAAARPVRPTHPHRQPSSVAVAGAGFEYKLNRNWSVRAEYLHFDFGSTSANLPDLGGFTNSEFFQTINLKEDIVRVGANYQFNWGAPVVAKY